jgi:CheY-like chemotaxis protein
MLCFSLFRHSLFTAFVVCLCALPTLAAPNLPERLNGESLSVTSYMEWMLDPSGALTVQEMVNMQDSFKVLGLQTMPHEAGTVWLRFTVPAISKDAARPASLLLDLGPALPGTPALYIPQVAPQPEKPLLEGKQKAEKTQKAQVPPVVQWKSIPPDRNGIFMLPEAQSSPQLCFIRLDGAPGPWFSPSLRTPHDAATTLDKFAYPAVLVALGIALLLCLLRAASERGQWRLWAGMYTLAALGHALTGIPSTPAGHVPMDQAVALLSPGLALMLFAHVGRHVMQTSRHSTLLDSQYIILSLPGAALIFLPLVPGFTWLVRYFPLWPVLTLLLLPSTLGAWLSGLVGARRFLLACLLPPLGVAVSMSLPVGLLAPEVLSTLPLWGVALSTLIIAGTSRQELPHNSAGACAQPELSLNDAPLSMEPAAQGLSLSLPQNDGLTITAQDPMPALDLPHISPRAPRPRLEEEEPVVFNLQQTLRDVHDTALPLAAPRNIGLSWYMPPQMGHWYIGYPQSLSLLLASLLESAIAATRQGTIQIAARRMPDSVDAGLLLFSVSDTGAGAPPTERPTEALLQAWEMTRARNGFLNMESSATGTSIAFSLQCKPVEQETDSPQATTLPQILLVDESLSNRQLLRYFLENMPYAIHEARTPAEAVLSQRHSPAALLIFDGQMDIARLAAAAQELRQNERAQHRPAALLLAITEDEHAWEDLHHAGFTHAIAKPLTRKALRNTVQELLPKGNPPAPTRQSAKTAPELLPDLSLETTHSAPAHKQEGLSLHYDSKVPAPSAPPLDLHLENREEENNNEFSVISGKVNLQSEKEAPLSMGESASPAAEAMPKYLPPYAQQASINTSAAAHTAPAASSSAPEQHGLPPAATPEAAAATSQNSASAQPQITAAPVITTPDVPVAPLRNASSAPYTGAYVFDEDALRDPTIRLLMPTAEDLAQYAPPAPRQEEDAPQAAQSPELNTTQSAPTATPLPQPHEAAASKSTQEVTPTAQPEPSLPQETVAHEAQKDTALSTSSAAQEKTAPQSSAAAQTIADIEMPVPVQARAPQQDNTALRMPPPQQRPAHDPVAAALERVQALLGKRRTAVQESIESPLPELHLTHTKAELTSPQHDAIPEQPAVTVQEAAPQAPAAVQAGSAPAPKQHESNDNMAQHDGVPPAPAAEHTPEQSHTRAPQSPVFEDSLREMLAAMDADMRLIRQALAAGNMAATGRHAGFIATNADKHGLRVLARMARCVESAAKALDDDALRDLLPELEATVERNRIALTQTK